MENRRHFLFLVAALAAAPLTVAEASQKPLQVVATTRDLATFAEQIGGERVDVQSICKGKENLHAVRLKPSHIVATSRADVFLEMGLSMEHAWVPGLLRTARNDTVQPGGEGFVNVSEGWEAIEIPDSLSRRGGTDLHPEGNPHFNLVPAGGAHMASSITEALVRIEPASEAHFRERHAKWQERYEAAKKRWDALGRELEGRLVASYHTEFNYLLQGYGVELVATLEPKPGVPPTASHLTEVIATMREREVSVVLTAAWSNGKSVRNVAKKTGALVVELPIMVGANAAATDWIAMMDDVHARLAEGFGIELPLDDPHDPDDPDDSDDGERPNAE